MSTQPQQPQTQQPVVVYPNTVSGQVPPSHSHSDGSFGTVFIVLAVIIVISAIACFLGRLCNKRKTSQSKPSKHNQSHSFRPKERDIEFGFDGRAPVAKPTDPGYPSGFKMPGNGDPRGFRVHEHKDPAGIRMPGNGDPTGFRMPGHGDIKGETKPVDDGAFKAGA
ncbi:hypothetical protein PTKIN_Ptkin17bG0082700 [Pterospermum kingtungense]